MREVSYSAGHWSVDNSNDFASLHTHKFDAQMLVLEGEFILELEDGKHTFKAGDTCSVSAGTTHAEHTGNISARILAGLIH
ncbi:MAG: cupin domain-containing protein [Acidimicrobiales bacterium]